MSKKEGVAWVPILNFILGIVGLFGFFLPYMSFLFIGISGYDLAVLGGYTLALIVPVGAIIALLFGVLAILMKNQYKIFGWLVLIGGLLVLIGAVYIFLQPGVSMIPGIGLFLDMIVGVLIVILGVLQAMGK